MNIHYAMLFFVAILFALLPLIGNSPEQEATSQKEAAEEHGAPTIISKATEPPAETGPNNSPEQNRTEERSVPQQNVPETPAYPAPEYPVHKNILTTVFWVGESADESNDHIANDESAWDTRWVEHFGGEDAPWDRCGYRPCAFTPRENPFYVALPYNDLDESGNLKVSASASPWFDEHHDKTSTLKNQWIAVRYDNTVCYGQWEDVGPFETDDVEYVFFGAPPKNRNGLGAGLDVSPALRDCLGYRGNARTDWWFMDRENVPDGPWKDTITTRPVTW